MKTILMAAIAAVALATSASAETIKPVDDEDYDCGSCEPMDIVGDATEAQFVARVPRPRPEYFAAVGRPMNEVPPAFMVVVPMDQLDYIFAVINGEIAVPAQ
ncbi:hypothetical protein H7X87_01040 [Acetobacteraceae bacterium]|nr:hypothetical protein [Candidatus Parcubacteria bacterium]